MKNALLKFITIAAMLVAGMTAAQALTTAGPDSPATVPPGYVITPFGYFHPSCVVHLAEGDELRPDQHVIRHANGTTDKMPGCAYPHYRADGETVIGDERGVKDPDISHSWIERASVTTTSSYDSLTAEWSVPETPTSNDGQTLFFFPGLEDIDDTVTIVQPVLGWNADFASAWGIASWNWCKKGTTYEGPPKRVSSGDNIFGFIGCASGTNPCTSWDISTSDLQNHNVSELLDSPSFGQTFNWAFGGVVEVYKIVRCSDYPEPGRISFGDQLVNDEGVVIANPGWSLNNLSSGLTPQCNYGGSLPRQVILDFIP